ncbi:MAG: histidine kinase [Sporolactobacillus sp.]
MADRMLVIVRLLRLFVSLLIVSSFWPLISHRLGLLVFMSGLLVLALLNDWLRHRMITDGRGETISLMVGLACVSLINFYWESLGADVYFVILLVEVMIGSKRMKKMPVLLLAYAYGLDMAFSMISRGFAVSLAHETASFALTLVPIVLFRYTLIERQRAEQLNSQLAAANAELHRRNDEIEQLTQTKERARIAQELHDSIGHALVALTMNLEFIEQAMTVSPERAMPVVVKTRKLASDSMRDLRRAVHVLRLPDDQINLHDAVQRLTRQLNTSGRLTIHLSSDQALENQPEAVKSCLYKTVREALTNGLRHGQASIFDIDLRQMGNCVQLRVTNNGRAPKEITASDGVKGIIARFQSLGGTASFCPLAHGFEVSGTIPLFDTNEEASK